MNKARRDFPSASVVIPTFDRLSDLQRVIRAILDQVAVLSSPCEVVVVDDGSSDGTGRWLDQNASEFGLTVIRQQNAGPAVARNKGVMASKGEIILFLGDDTEPQPGWLWAHLETHRLEDSDRPMAVLGYTTFPPEEDSPFLRWINEFGAQFGYALIEDPTNVPFNFFYTSNISLSRQFFEELGGFREDFRGGLGGYRVCLPRGRSRDVHQISPEREDGSSPSYSSGVILRSAGDLGSFGGDLLASSPRTRGFSRRPLRQ